MLPDCLRSASADSKPQSWTFLSSPTGVWKPLMLIDFIFPGVVGCRHFPLFP